MRILFSSRPAFGHVFAIAPLADAARAAGHDVIFGSGEDFLPRLKGWGFETRKIGEGIDWAFGRTAEQHPQLLQPEQPEFGARMFVDTLGPATVRDARAVIEQDAPDIVVYEATDIGAGVAAAAAGVPAICHSLSVWVEEFQGLLRERAHLLWEQIGMEPRIDATLGDVFLDIWPPSMRPPGAPEGRSLRPLTWADPSADVPAITDVAGPLVFVTLGTMFHGKDLLQKVIAALAEIDRDALVLTGADSTVEDLPAGGRRIRVGGFVNQAEVLRRADVVIHHGGAGTMLGALSQGLPALAIGDGADRIHTAASLARSGAGLVLNPRTATEHDIAQAVEALLTDDSYRRRAREIRTEIEAMPSPAQVLEQLAALTRHG